MPTLHTNDDAPLTCGGLLLWLGYVGLRTGRLLAEALQPALELVLYSVYVISSILQACPALTTMPRSLVFMAVDLIRARVGLKTVFLVSSVIAVRARRWLSWVEDVACDNWIIAWAVLIPGVAWHVFHQGKMWFPYILKLGDLPVGLPGRTIPKIYLWQGFLWYDWFLNVFRGPLNIIIWTAFVRLVISPKLPRGACMFDRQARPLDVERTRIQRANQSPKDDDVLACTSYTGVRVSCEELRRIREFNSEVMPHMRDTAYRDIRKEMNERGFPGYLWHVGHACPDPSKKSTRDREDFGWNLFAQHAADNTILGHCLVSCSEAKHWGANHVRCTRRKDCVRTCDSADDVSF